VNVLGDDPGEVVALAGLVIGLTAASFLVALTGGIIVYRFVRKVARR
jgi:hypothetical protein